MEKLTHNSIQRKTRSIWNLIRIRRVHFFPQNAAPLTTVSSFNTESPLKACFMYGIFIFFYAPINADAPIINAVDGILLRLTK